MKICDLTQFYSPVSGGVKRYVQAKIRYIQTATDDEHLLIIPGPETEVVEAQQSRICTVRSPLVSRISQYRALLDLRALAEIVERDKPDLIESGDPYQVGWKAIACGAALGVPVIGFYHSHFAEAYLRTSARVLGPRAAEIVMQAARAYTCNLYNRCAATLVPSAGLAALLRDWGVRNVRCLPLGVDPEIFQPQPHDAAATRDSLGVRPAQRLLLYVGRLAQEKNTHTLLAAFEQLARRLPGKFHLLVVGDGLQRTELRRLQTVAPHVTWHPYCADPLELARLYRAADLFVHPGTQETFGLTALECQACGTPLVGIRGTFMDEVIIGAQENWATENSASALATAIERAAASCHRDEEMAAEVRSRYAWTVVFRRLFTIYREICAGQGGDAVAGHQISHHTTKRKQ